MCDYLMNVPLITGPGGKQIKGGYLLRYKRKYSTGPIHLYLTFSTGVKRKKVQQIKKRADFNLTVK